MRKIPIDVSSFEILRRKEYVYVDKTKEIYDLVNGGRFYFLSRPRRFGKSLLISTLKELFLGHKELFTDLWIERETEYAWPKHPVIHLDFSQLPIDGGIALKNGLNWLIELKAKEYECDVTKAPEPGLKLISLVQQLSRKNPVVILIDEYDYPLINNITNQVIAEENHFVLRNFYSTMKGLDEYLQAIVVTGVTKFSKTSIFSGLNSLNDLSFDPRAASLLGYTKDEIHHFFSSQLEELAAIEGIGVEKVLDRMQAWYDGYRFSESPLYVFNPFSVMYCLHKQKFANFWFESGTPKFLVQLLQKHEEKLEDLKEIELSSTALGPFDIGEEPLIPILFQAGYLSICDYSRVTENDRVTELYKLKYPNLEVAESFQKYLLAAYTHGTYRESDLVLTELIVALRQNNVSEFCQALQSLLAHIPYQLHIAEEKYYHSLFQLLASLLGIEAQSEVSTDKGRIDMVLHTKTHIFVFEIKFDVDAQTALKQIDDRKYYERYLLQKKDIVLVGISFNPQKERLTLDYAVKGGESDCHSQYK